MASMGWKGLNLFLKKKSKMLYFYTDILFNYKLFSCIIIIMFILFDRIKALRPSSLFC